MISTKSVVTNEQQVLKLILDNPNLLATLDDNYFVSEVGKDLFEAFRVLRLNNAKFIDSSILSEGSKLNKEIDSRLIQDLRNVEADISNFDYNVKRLKSDFSKVKLQDVTMKNLVKIVNGKGDLDLEAISEIQKEINRTVDFVHGGEKKVYTMEELVKDYEEELKLRVKGEGYISTGDSYLDSKLHGGGFLKGSINIIHGPSGMGKSIFALNLIAKQINKQIPCFYSTPEMGKDATMDRLLALRSILTTNQLGNIYNADVEALDFIMDAVKKEGRKLSRLSKFRLLPSADTSLVEIADIVKTHKREMGVKSAVVTIDLLTMLKEFNKNSKGGKASDYEDAMNLAHVLARQGQDSYLGVVQTRREQMKVVIKDIEDVYKLSPGPESIKSSSAVYERARSVMGIFRPKHVALQYLGETAEVVVMDDTLICSIQKANMGQLANLKYLYDGSKSKLWKYIEDENSEE